ncbi:MAG: preprotein translocase subunit SecA [Candidatus Omnitrophota bacterium]
MFNFLVHNIVVKSAQRSIDRLDPKVDVHLPKDLPLPSIHLIKKMCVIVSQVNGMETRIAQMNDAQLRTKTEEFKRQYQSAIASAQKELLEKEQIGKKALSQEQREDMGQQILKAKNELKRARREILDRILPEAFAVVREAGKRVLSMRHYDIQLVGGMALYHGNIAEMATGEGKTLVATLPAYLNALTGEGVHVVTVNDYLARRDRDWMGPLYEFLGLTVGVIQHDLDPESRRAEYGCDITYGTNNEFGFDYLRDNMVNFKEDMVQRAHHFAIVDEVDSILIDEARTPLIISGPAEESTDKYYKANEITKRLKGRRITEQEEVDAKYRAEDLSKGFDYIADEKARSIALTEEGEGKIAKMFGIDNLHEMETIEYRHHILQALKAREFFRVDVDYVVRDGQVIIVDEFTGRMMPGRRWSDGLHQAVEAKEGIKIERENQTLATITFQNYFRMYEKLSGMTGTAHTEATEFKEIYNLDCVVMPTNRILKRTNHPDCIYKTVKEKFTAVVEEISEKYKKGQPVLVGTISIENSELLSSLLKRKGIPHQVLNAKYHELEAQIVAQAGRFKAITIATNMAGRGTDIVLGGNAEFLAKSLADDKVKESQDESQKENLVQKFLQQFREQVKQEHEKVVAVGGLHVLGTERHESRRIDNQLRGRSGRQGDPGSSRFYVSLEDNLMRLFASDRIMGIMNRLGMEEGQVIEHPWVTKAIEIAQKRVENYNFEIRKQLLDFDNVMNKQREVIYSLRRSILESDAVKEYILEAIDETIVLAVQQYLFPGPGETNADAEGLNIYLQTKFHYELSANDQEKLGTMTEKEIIDMVLMGVLQKYEEKEKEVGAEDLRHLEKIFLLHTIDAKWKDHLYAMDQLKEGIGLRSYAQRDPVVEYKREGFEMFQQMRGSINQDVAETIFKVQPVGQRTRLKGVFSSLPQQLVHHEFSSLSREADSASGGRGRPPAPPAGEGETSAAQTYHKEGPKVGRNDPCPCGSGKKYKRCCGR